jgi:hypothetical protein
LGNVFNFGDAVFFGSASRLYLPGAMSGIVTSPSGLGYTLVDQTGDVFNYGDAHAFGSKSGVKVPHPIVGITLSIDAAGYILASAGGNLYNFGDAGFAGSPVHSVKGGALVVGVAITS